MIKPSWGLKRLCQGCGAHFYDLKRRPIVCPKCETICDLENLYRSKRGRNTDQKEETGAIIKLFKEDIGIDLEDKDDAETLLEDTSDLENDEDLPEVVEDEDEEEE